MFLAADKFFQELMGIRSCALTGHVGSGKTLGAIAIACELLRRQFVSGVWGNLNHSLPHSESLERSCIILDEASIVMDSRWSSVCFDLYGSFVRKYKGVYLYPSVHQVDKRARNLEVMRLVDIDTIPFLRTWVYRWESTSGAKGTFFLLRPQEYFDYYDHEFVPTSDGGTLEALCSMYPETVNEILESRSGKRLQRLMGYDTGSRSGGSRSVSGSVVSGLSERVERLEAELENVRMMVYGLTGNIESTSNGASQGEATAIERWRA
ncbi:MAG: hypothetical protein HZC40_12065 [Chloroflexi bacterium]|nr:hypothetical protein [Chloroflexota bacterium]